MRSSALWSLFRPGKAIVREKASISDQDEIHAEIPSLPSTPIASEETGDMYMPFCDVLEDLFPPDGAEADPFSMCPELATSSASTTSNPNSMKLDMNQQAMGEVMYDMEAQTSASFYAAKPISGTSARSGFVDAKGHVHTESSWPAQNVKTEPNRTPVSMENDQNDVGMEELPTSKSQRNRTKFDFSGRNLQHCLGAQNNPYGGIMNMAHYSTSQMPHSSPMIVGQQPCFQSMVDQSAYEQSTSAMYMEMPPSYLSTQHRVSSEDAHSSSAYTYGVANEQFGTMDFFPLSDRRRSNSFTRNLLTLLRRQKIRSQPQHSPSVLLDLSCISNQTSQFFAEMGLIKAAHSHPAVDPISNAWFLAYYYELNQQIGEPFVGCYDQVVVDGLCAPSEAERFCLGAIPNVERNSAVDVVRRQIGNGVRIYRLGEDVYAQCLCDKIFVQSPLYAIRCRDLPHTVYRIGHGETMEIFNSNFFLSLLKERAGGEYRALQSLQALCHMRISFVKGWGQSYKRQTITSTPCWIDAQLKVPLSKLDKVLSQCPGPLGTVNSYT